MNIMGRGCSHRNENINYLEKVTRNVILLEQTSGRPLGEVVLSLEAQSHLVTEGGKRKKNHWQ